MPEDPATAAAKPPRKPPLKKTAEAKAQQKADIAFRRARVARWLRERRSQEWMADQEGCGKATINRDVAWVLAQVQGVTIADALEWKQREIHILDEDERDLRTDFTLLTPLPTPLGEVVTDADIAKPEDSLVLKRQRLNMARTESRLRVYDRIMVIMERRAKISNLDAPLPPADDEAPDVQPPETDSAAVEAALIAYETAILQTYPAQRVGLVSELPPDGDPPDEGGDPA